MKFKIFILFCIIAFTISCEEDKITLYNTQPTPDLSDPIIQKLTNVTWYRDGGISAVQEEWSTLTNIPKPSEAMASLLYSMAWLSIKLNRDGTSSMLFTPPVFPHVYIHCQGTWMVSEKEPQTIIVNTKTPVSSVSIKLKVLNLEIKDNVAKLILSMDFGNRLLTAFLANDISHSVTKQASDDWYENNPVLSAPLQSKDFIGSWAAPRYDWDNYHTSQYPLENIVRSTYVDDLFASTPNLFSGVKFTFEDGGKAYISYTKDYEESFGTDKEVASEGSWSVKGNKLVFKTDEEFFYSAGEVLFGFPINAPNLTLWGTVNKIPIRTQSNRFYIIEMIKRESHGMWCRITSNDANFYTFLFNIDEPVKDYIKITNLAD